MLKKSLIMLMKCTYNSQYIAHYAQFELTIIYYNVMLTKTDTGISRAAISVLQSYLDSKVGTS